MGCCNTKIGICPMKKKARPAKAEPAIPFCRSYAEPAEMLLAGEEYEGQQSTLTTGWGDKCRLCRLQNKTVQDQAAAGNRRNCFYWARRRTADNCCCSGRQEGLAEEAWEGGARLWSDQSMVTIRSSTMSLIFSNVGRSSLSGCMH